VERYLAADITMTSRSTAVYLYCVVRAPRRPVLGRAPDGVAGATRPAAHRLHGSLWLVTADVPLDVYGTAQLEPHLRDLDWVAEVAVGHEALVEYASRARGAVVVPMKLFTLFSSLDKALADTMARRATIDTAVKRIAGCQEWGVRVTRRAGLVADAPDLERAGGAEFLRSRKRARDEAAAARTRSLAAADAAFARLERHARDAYRRERRREPGSNPPVLDAAFLVTAASRVRFKAEARKQAVEVAKNGAELTLTGPWPAYNFVA
jgi:hypothetical protein